MGFRRTHPPEKWGHYVTSTHTILIVFTRVIIKEILAKGSDFPWIKPRACPSPSCGGTRLWGHGFVTAFFDGFTAPIPLKRYRCPDCGCVIRMRPEGYPSRFQAPIQEIRHNLFQRLRTGKWPRGPSRPRLRHWLRALKRRALAILGHGWPGGLMAAFDHLLSRGHNPVSRVM